MPDGRSTSAPSAAADLWLRVRRFFLLKFAGTTLWTWAFFVAYFHLLEFPNGAVATVRATALDAIVPFQPQWMIAYVSLWIYVGIAPGLQLRFVELLAYGFWAGGLLLAGLAFFYLWPTQVPAGTFDPMGFPGFELMKGIDAAGNACPSMHVAIALFTALWVDLLFREIGVARWMRIANASWFAAIAYSTLALKQHVVIDVVAGALLGVAFAVPSQWLRPGRGRAGRPAIIGRRTDDAAPSTDPSMESKR